MGVVKGSIQIIVWLAGGGLLCSAQISTVVDSQDALVQSTQQDINQTTQEFGVIRLPRSFRGNSFSVFMAPQIVNSPQQAARSFDSTFSLVSSDYSTEDNQEVQAEDSIAFSLPPSIFFQNLPSSSSTSCVTVMDYLAQEPKFSMFLEMIEIAGLTRFFNSTELEGTLFVTENAGFEQVFERFGISREEFYADSQLPRIAAYSILDVPIKTEDLRNLELVDTVLPDAVIYIKQDLNNQLSLIPIATEFAGEIIEGDKQQCNIIVHEVSTLMLPVFNQDGTPVQHPGPNAVLTLPLPLLLSSPQSEYSEQNNQNQYYQYILSKKYYYQNGEQAYNQYKKLKQIPIVITDAGSVSDGNFFGERLEYLQQEFGG